MAFYIPEEKISEIQNVADIIDIVSESVLLKKAGKNHIGLCPFHSEKTPSFTVNPEKQIFHCFGCGEGGNVFRFLMKHDGLSFPEAVQTLARRYGISLPHKEMTPAQKKMLSEREQVIDVNRHAMNYFRQMLLRHPAGQPGRQYLSARGLHKETLETFHVGYVPDGWRNLMPYLMQKKIPADLMAKAGLILENRQKTGYYDRFRNRIIFPIFNMASQVVGFGGRVLDKSLPKYLNSPETLVYSKSNSLYGLHLAKPECRKTATVYIVEGYMDLLALWQHGIRNVVATLGTSMTSEHVRMLKGHCEKAILVYDSDDAGLKAAARSIEIFDKGHLDASIMILPDGHDPDSYLFEKGEGAFRELAQQALGTMDFLMESAIRRNGLSVEGKVQTVSAMKTYLADIEDPVSRSLYAKKLAERLDIDDAAIMEKVREAMHQREQGGFRAMPNPDADRNAAKNPLAFDRMEKQMIAMMIQFPEIIPEIRKQHVMALFENRTLQGIGRTITEQYTGKGLSISDLIANTGHPEQEKLIASFAIETGEWNRVGCLRLIRQFVLSKNKKNNDLLKQIKTAEAQNDNELLISLVRQLRDQKQIQNKRESAGGKVL